MGGRRPGRAPGTKPPRAAGTQKGKRDPEGEGNQEKTERGQGGQAGRHAVDLKARSIPSISQPGTRRIFAKAPSVEGPPGHARVELGALFKQSRSPAGPGCRRPPVLTPMLNQSVHPGVRARCCVLPFVVKRCCRSSISRSLAQCCVRRKSWGQDFVLLPLSCHCNRRVPWRPLCSSHLIRHSRCAMRDLARRLLLLRSLTA